MKLFTKIFLQVICMVLLLSSGIFFYTTYRWKNQSIQNINSYENSRFQTNISKFENMLMRIKSKTQDSDDKIREKMIIYTFRQVFHDSAVLYQDGKEQYNGTKYEFDLQNIRNLTKNKHDGFENDIYCDKPLISKTNGNVFLLFYFSSYSSTDMNYQIVTYKDITSVQKQSQTLFYQAGGFTLFLVLFVGFFLFLTLRKIMEPLTRLKEAAVSVANGNYEIKVPSEGKTELAQVGKSFNSWAKLPSSCLCAWFTEESFSICSLTLPVIRLKLFPTCARKLQIYMDFSWKLQAIWEKEQSYLFYGK